MELPDQVEKGDQAMSTKKLSVTALRRKERKDLRKATRPHPYQKEAKMTDAAVASAADAAASMVPTGETRGQMLQRHKREYKEVKKQVDQLREQKKRLGKKEQNAKATKKEMGKRAQSMLDELAARHARELASLETAKAATMQTDATPAAPPPSVSVSFTAALAAAGNSPYPKPEHASLMAAVRQAQALSHMSDSTSPSSSSSAWSLPFPQLNSSASGMQFKS